MQQISFTIKFLDQEIPVHYIKDIDTAKYILSNLQGKGRLIGIDTETRPNEKYLTHPQAGLSPKLSRIRLLQIYDGFQSIVFDCDYIKNFTIFKDFLESEKFVAHNAIFDYGFFISNIGVTEMNLSCIRLLARIIMHARMPTDEGLDASLENLVKQIYGERVLKYAQTSDWTVPELTFEQVEYAAFDAVYVYKLAEKFATMIAKYGMGRYWNLIKRAQLPICRMSLNGMSLNVEKHKDSIARWRAELYEAKTELLRITGLEELTGPRIATWLEENLPQEILDVWAKTPTGNLSVNADAFINFPDLEIVKPFRTYKTKEILTSTFGTKLLDLINPETKRIHCSYNIAGARTGRLSSSKPNFQNFPRDKAIRSTFIPREGHVFVCADYSQIEVRVAGELSRDPEILNAFRNGIDIHTLTASKMARKSVKDVTKDERQKAKAVVFGNLFGIGASKFSHYAKKSYGVTVSQSEAKAVIDLFKSTYSGYHKWQMNQADRAKETLMVTTPTGKVRRLPEDNTYGNSMNHPVQGGAAECMLNSLIYLEQAFRSNSLSAKLCNTVHDEILVECLPEEADAVKALVEECMTEGFLTVFPGGVTRGIVEAHSGTDWASAKP